MLPSGSTRLAAHRVHCRYDRLREQAVSYLAQNYSHSAVQSALPNMIQRVTAGERPHAGAALLSLLGLLTAVARPPSDIPTPKLEREMPKLEDSPRMRSPSPLHGWSSSRCHPSFYVVPMLTCLAAELPVPIEPAQAYSHPSIPADCPKAGLLADPGSVPSYYQIVLGPSSEGGPAQGVKKGEKKSRRRIG